MESVEVFAKAAARLQQRRQEAASPSPVVAFSRHPGANISTDVERRLFGAAGAKVRFVEGIASPLLAAAANLTASQDSTASDAALFVGTPSLFAVATSAPPPANLGVETGLIPVARTPQAVVEAYTRVRDAGFHISPQRLCALGVPLGAEARIAQRIAEMADLW